MVIAIGLLWPVGGFYFYQAWKLFQVRKVFFAVMFRCAFRLEICGRISRSESCTTIFSGGNIELQIFFVVDYDRPDNVGVLGVREDRRIQDTVMEHPVTYGYGFVFYREGSQIILFCCPKVYSL